MVVGKNIKNMSAKFQESEGAGGNLVMLKPQEMEIFLGH